MDLYKADKNIRDYFMKLMDSKPGTQVFQEKSKSLQLSKTIDFSRNMR